jgi:molecular chaperone GrpE
MTTETNAEIQPEKTEGEEQENSSSKKEETSSKVETPPQEDFKTKYMYLLADMENLKKRCEKEKEALIKFGNERLISSLVRILDDLDRSIEHFGEIHNLSEIKKGLEMVRKNFRSTLENNGLTVVESVGKDFDPHFHEAVSHQTKEGAKDGEILIEYQKGYLLNGRLLRPARVVVVKNN